MMQPRTCRTCGIVFPGGPRAYYCPVCRAVRIRETNRRHKRNGPQRPLGSIDICAMCGNQYMVVGGNQRFCPDCAPVHRLEYDRVTSIRHYYLYRERINPVRMIRRRVGLSDCVICGNQFDPQHTRRITCSNLCRRTLLRRYWQKGDKKRSPRKK